MRVLMIATSFPKYPGEMTAPFIEEIAAAVVRRGHEVHMVLPDHPELKREPVVRGIHLHRFAYAPHPRLSVWGYAAALHNDVAMRRAAFAVAPVAVAASWRALRRLTQQYRFAMIHAHWAIPNGLPAWLVARERGLPLVVSTHGSDISVAERLWPVSLVARRILRDARAITAPSSDLTTRAAGLGARPERLHVMPYCVDPEAFRPDPAQGAAFRAAQGLGPDVPLLFTVGRMVEKKGFIYLVRAMVAVLAAHSRARLMVAGYGPGQAVLEQEAARLGIAHAVLFPGALERDAVSAGLNAADIFVLPSVRDSSGNVDGLPNTLMEAMGAGRPIVASRIAGVPGVIDDGVHGLLVPPGRPEPLAKALIALLSDAERRAELGRAARARIDQDLTWDRYAARLEALYTAKDPS